MLHLTASIARRLWAHVFVEMGSGFLPVEQKNKLNVPIWVCDSLV